MYGVADQLSALSSHSPFPFPLQSPFVPCLASVLSTLLILGMTFSNASRSPSLGSNPSFFSAASEMYSPAVPQARRDTPTAMRIWGVRFRNALREVSGVVRERGERDGEGEVPEWRGHGVRKCNSIEEVEIECSWLRFGFIWTERKE